jgi:lysophospholipid acyltransferase (LPLAT)-like uncharacterized protein
LNSWDHFLLPKPFARATVAYEPFLYAPAGAPRELAGAVDPYREALNRAASRAEQVATGSAEVEA